MTNLHAFLIGIDCYLPNTLPDGGSYPNLQGCARDVEQIEAFLRERLNLRTANIIKLTASHDENQRRSRKPKEPEKQWPTYENIVAAFKEITKRAKPNDQVYIHYSGHGGRTPTIFPKVKSPKALDESLVPLDIGNANARYLRDVELAYLLKEMVDKRLVVTVILDSCHSGGAARGKGSSAVRGIPSIDTTSRPQLSDVASLEDLQSNWQNIPVAQSKAATLSSGWLPDMKDTVILAACRANELANEFTFDGRERNGALTYWLLDSLRQLGPHLTYHNLHDRILAKVRAKFPEQTPQLQGQGSRILFGITRMPRLPGAGVLKVDKKRVRIEMGKIHGLDVGARFAIYKAGKSNTPIAWAEVIKSDDSDSWAEITKTKPGAKIEIGGRAVLLDEGRVNLKNSVRLVHQKDGPAAVVQTNALKRLRAAMVKNSWLRIAQKSKEADLQIVVNFNKEYEIWDPSGQVINLRPAIKTGLRNGAQQLVQRLEHLTKYRNVKLIENRSPTNWLAQELDVQVTGSKNETVPGSALIVNDGEKIILRIHNRSAHELNITVLDLQPDWGITQVYPSDADYEELSPGAERNLPFTMELSEDYRTGIDTLKVFATVNPTSFSGLALPALDEAPVERTVAKEKHRANQLERWLDAFNDAKSARNLRLAKVDTASDAPWTCSQVDIKVRRPPQALNHFRDPMLSLLQAAFDEVRTESTVAARSKGAGELVRTSVSDPLFDAVTDSLLNGTSPTSEKGITDTAKYCSNMAAGMAKELWNKIRGKGQEYEIYKDALTAKFGDCDPRFAKALVKYAEYLARGEKVPYRRWKQVGDFVLAEELQPDAVIGVVADWGTGQREAIQVLQQLKQHDPHVVVHLGDVYYAGTRFEMQNYFYNPWIRILQPDQSGIRSFALAGNHDLYSGGRPYYELIDRLQQPASYFCYRNSDWQIIGIDTALNDRLNGPPTTLDPLEVEWLADKILNSEQRRTILLSHHQLFSTNDDWNGDSFNRSLYNQVAGLLPAIDLWLWGHEHDLVVFEPHLGLKRGRCVGGSAFPVGKYEMPDLPKNSDVPYNKKVTLAKGPSFYQHCYALIKLAGRKAKVDFFEDGDGGRLLFTESI